MNKLNILFALLSIYFLFILNNQYYVTRVNNSSLDKIKNLVKIYYINLEKRTDRKYRIIKELKKSYFLNNNYFRYSAINGNSSQIKKNYNIPNFEKKKGWIGCALSHINLWQKCLVEKKNYIIFEDDIFLYKNFDNNIEHIIKNLPNKFDMIYLLSTDYAIKIKFNNLFDKLIDKNFLLNGYILSPKGAKKLLNKIYPYNPEKQIDSWIVKNTRNGYLDNYIIKNKIIWTYQDTDSDVQTNISQIKYHGL